MRTRINDWIDVDNNEIKLGLDVSNDGRTWHHLAIDGKPYFASNEHERELKRKELRKGK